MKWLPPRQAAPCPQPFFTCCAFQPCYQLWGPTQKILKDFNTLLYCVALNCTQYSKWGWTNAKLQWEIHLFYQGTLLARVEPAYCFLLSCSPATNLPVCARVWHSPVPGGVPEMRFILVELHATESNLSWFLYMASPPLRESTAPASFVLSRNLLMTHWTPASRSLIKVLSRTEPWGSLLVIACQPDEAPLILLFELYHQASLPSSILWTCSFHSWMVYQVRCCERPRERLY